MIGQPTRVHHRKLIAMKPSPTSLSDRAPHAPHRPHQSHQPYQRLPAALAACVPVCLAASFATAAPLSTRVAPEPAAIEPVVLIQDGTLAACGLRALFQTGTARIRFSVVNHKDGPATRFELTTFWQDTREPDLAPADARLVTATLDSAEMFTDKARTAPAASAATTQQGGPAPHVKEARLDGLTGARLVQSLMVGGGRLSLTAKDGQTLELNMPGPMPNLIRASYLNCAGDLFRPEGESREAREEAARSSR